MKYILIAGIAISVMLLSHYRFESEYQRGFSDALKSAYKTNPPNEELELTCAGLWIGDQAKKQWRKENAGNAK